MANTESNPNPIIQNKINIDSQTGAFILIDMLLAKNIINKKTYDKIQAKYKHKEVNNM